MRLPKTVNICGKTYVVKENRKSFDGGGSTSNLSLWVGTKSGSPERITEIFVHEIMEIIACERDVRYGASMNDGTIFVMNHKEFDNFAADVSATLWPMLRDKENDSIRGT